MSTASLAASDRGAAVRIDRLFLGLALAATAILITLVLLDHQPASAALILGGFGLGIAFLKAEFSYTASWRRFLTRGDAGGLLGGLIVIAYLCACGGAGRRAKSEIWRSHRAARSFAGHRRVCLRRRHAARQRLRLGHALHRRRRLGAHADRPVVLRHRQRIRQPVVAVVPCAWWRRSGAGLGLSRRLGRVGGDARQHRRCCQR